MTLDDDQKDHLADWFWLKCKANDVRFALSVEDAFIEKVEQLLDSGLQLITAKLKAFDFVCESQA